MTKIRLAKFIADSGAASRRQAEQLIESGAVLVDGVKITTPVFFVDGTEKIEVRGKRLEGIGNHARVFAFNKPINTMTTSSDPAGRKTIYDVLKHASAIGAENLPPLQSLKYVGRLDYKTTGLMLLTNSGDLARRLTLPSAGLERVYIAKLHPKNLSEIKSARELMALKKFLSPLSADDSIFDKLRNGITIGGVRYAPMKIELMSRYPLGVKIILTEGKKNEIRNAFDFIGLPVSKLHRISYGPIELVNLAPGKIRELAQKDIDGLKKYF